MTRDGIIIPSCIHAKTNNLDITIDLRGSDFFGLLGVLRLRIRAIDPKAVKWAR